MQPLRIGQDDYLKRAWPVFQERFTKHRKLLVSLQTSEAFGGLLIAAAVQRKAMGGAERQRFTFRYPRRTVAITFSTMLEQASERRSSFGKPSRVAVRISSIPSRIEPETPDQSRSRAPSPWGRAAAGMNDTLSE
jgi:hypothetical protein